MWYLKIDQEHSIFGAAGVLIKGGITARSAYFWSAGNEGMEKKMETTTLYSIWGYIGVI